MLTEEQREVMRQAQKAMPSDDLAGNDEAYYAAIDLVEPLFKSVIEQGDPEAIREFVCRCPIAFHRAEARGWLETNGHGRFGHAEAQAWADAFKERAAHHG